MEIKNNWRRNNECIHPLVILVEGAVTKNTLKYLENIRLTKTTLRVGQENSTIAKRVTQYANTLDMPPDLRG